MADDNLSKNMKVLRKDIKRAKLFAIQYLTRRMKMLTNKRGTEQQVEKNTRKAARFEKELEYIKELEIEIVVEKIENKDSNYLNVTDIEDIQERSLARIISSKPIQKYIEQSKSTNDEKKTSTKHEDTESRVRETTAKTMTNKVKSRRRQIIKKESSHYGELEPADMSDVSSDNDVTLSGIEQTVSSFFVGSLSSTKDCDTTRQNKKSSLQNKGNLTRKLGKEKRGKDKQKKSSNRMGQRARQRLWKEKYGSKAKHFMNSDKMKKGNRMKQQKKFAKRKENLMQDVSHPSWEASKRRKMQQNISGTTFQGQKITFQDSD